MRIKHSVRVRGMRETALVAMFAAAEVYRLYGEDFVLTSATDGNHMPGSFHHTGDAIDIRLPANAAPDMIAGVIRDRLPDEYQVIVEDDHIHIEYDPR